MTGPGPGLRILLLVVASLLAGLVIAAVLPDQPIRLQPIGEAAINRAPALRISLAGAVTEAAPTPAPQAPTPPVAALKPKPKPKPEPVPEPKPVPQPQTKPAAPPDRVTAPAPAATTADAKGDRAEQSQEVSQQEVTLTAGASAEADNYLSRLIRHISRFYQYPRRARRLGQQGIPVLEFSFGRNGTLTGARLRETSGHDLLDQAAVDMLELANPLPAVPEQMPGASFSFALPVRFSLR